MHIISASDQLKGMHFGMNCTVAPLPIRRTVDDAGVELF